ncbi:MAG: hypothetical protein IT317_00915 [Anaerolineales bacterium]|nr:hypothetical protein [Anaerolineales bacterium]
MPSPPRRAANAELSAWGGPAAGRRLAQALAWLGLLALLVTGSAFAPPRPAAAPDPRVGVPRFAAAAPTPPPDQLLLARVHFSTTAERDALAARLDAVEAPTTGGYVTALLSPAEQAALLAQGYRVEIDAARTALLNAHAPASPAQAQGISGYPCYRTVAETYAALAGLAAAHPTLAQWVDIGDSYDKLTAGGPAGYDLFVLTLTNQAVPGPKPALFLMAAIHAREYATAETATRFTEYLVNQYGVDPDVTWLLDNFEIHVLPQANPDGRLIAEGGLYQRKNTNPSGAVGCLEMMSNQYGVDLNRNADWHWNTVGVQSDKCSQTYPGLSAASEPEIQAIQTYLAALFPDARGPGGGDPAPADNPGLMLTLHSYGQMVLFPWGDTQTPAPNQAALQTLGRKFGFHTGYEVCPPSACLYLTSGTTDDWTYGQLGAAAFTIEMGTWFFQECGAFESEVYPRNLSALLYAAQAARRPYLAPAGPETLTVTAAISPVVVGAPLTLTATADDTRYFSNGWGSESSEAIAAARYSIDALSWVTGTLTYPLSAADGAFNSPVEALTGVVDTSGLTAGRHLVLIESQDAAGHWGVPSAVFIDVLVGPDFELTPSPSAVAGWPGEPATHTLTLTNTSAFTVTFALTATSGAWPVTTPLTLGPLAPGAALPFDARVAVPAPAQPGDWDAASLRVTPLEPPGVPLTFTLLSVAHTPYGLSALPAAQAQGGGLGTLLTYTVVVTALGDLADTFTVTVSGPAWPTLAPAVVGPLALGESAAVVAQVSVPYGVSDGAADAATLTFTSQGDPARVAAVTLTSTAAWPRRSLPFVFR